MDNTLLMRLLQGLRDFYSNLQNLIKRKRALLQALGDSLAFEILHDQEVGAVLSANVVERADIGMLERGNSFGFALHPLFQLRVRGQVRGQNFDGNSAVEAGVPRPIDLAHTTHAERGDDFIRTEFGASG